MAAEAKNMPPTPESKIQQRQEKVEREQQKKNPLEKGLEDTFPASDPVAVTQPPKTKKEKREP